MYFIHLRLPVRAIHIDDRPTLIASANKEKESDIIACVPSAVSHSTNLSKCK